jgi:hypothetical protein
MDLLGLARIGEFDARAFGFAGERPHASVNPHLIAAKEPMLLECAREVTLDEVGCGGMGSASTHCVTKS